MQRAPLYKSIATIASVPAATLRYIRRGKFVYTGLILYIDIFLDETRFFK